MKTSLIFSLTIAATALGLAGCSSADFKRSGTSALDGTWRETSVQCSTRSDDPSEKQINDALSSGQVSAEMHIDGSRASSKVQTWSTRDHAKGEGRGYCEINLDQRWDVIANHVQVTDMGANQKSHDGNTCGTGNLELHDPRVHNFILLGNKLKVYMNTTISFNAAEHMTSIRSTNCPGGEPVVVTFERN